MVLILNISAESMVELSFEQRHKFETSLRVEVIIHTLKNRQRTREYHRTEAAEFHILKFYMVAYC